MAVGTNTDIGSYFYIALKNAVNIDKIIRTCTEIAPLIKTTWICQAKNKQHEIDPNYYIRPC